MDDDRWDDEEFRNDFYKDIAKLMCRDGGNEILFNLPTEKELSAYKERMNILGIKVAGERDDKNLFTKLREYVPEKYRNEFDDFFDSHKMEN